GGGSAPLGQTSLSALAAAAHPCAACATPARATTAGDLWGFVFGGTCATMQAERDGPPASSQRLVLQPLLWLSAHVADGHPIASNSHGCAARCRVSNVAIASRSCRVRPMSSRPLNRQ